MYVATVTADLEERRSQIVRQFSAWNCRVLPEENTLPPASAELRPILDSHLSQCIFAVHVVSAQRGIIPDGEEQSVIVLQYERARDRGLEQIVWIPKDSEPHSTFRSALEKGIQTGLDLLESANIDDLIQLLEERINSSLSLARAGISNTLRSIYVVCHPGDWDSAYRLKECLESQQWTVWYPIRQLEDASMRLRDHQQRLKSSHAVLLYWGRAKESWFRESLGELIVARQKRRKRPLPIVCLSYPPDADRDQYRRPDVFFSQVQDLDCETVRPVICHLQTSDSGGE